MWVYAMMIHQFVGVNTVFTVSLGLVLSLIDLRSPDLRDDELCFDEIVTVMNDRMDGSIPNINVISSSRLLLTRETEQTILEFGANLHKLGLILFVFSENQNKVS